MRKFFPIVILNGLFFLCFTGYLGIAFAKDLPDSFVNSAGIKMIRVDKGEIKDLETVKDDEFKEIVIVESYALAEMETTVGQWLKFMTENPDFPDGSNRVKNPAEAPVGGVTYQEAEEFCRKLTEHESKAGTLPEGFVYKLPTEEMWEFACRAGSKGPYSLPVEEIANHYWVNKNEAKVMTVSDLKPNPWGFHHMNGNYLEWCRPGADKVDNLGNTHPQRGGCYRFGTDGCRSGVRRFLPDSNHPVHSFRIALLKEPAK
jgi:formylglycine-generating enzyme required for sulfatase activity